MKQFAAYLRKHHLKALAEENQRALRALEPPMLTAMAGLSQDTLAQQMKSELDALLYAWEQGRGTEHALEGIQLWEAGGVATASPDSLEVTDMVLACMAQKQAMLSFLEGYTRDTSTGKHIREALNKHYTAVRSEATEAVIRLRVARKRDGEKNPAR